MYMPTNLQTFHRPFPGIPMDQQTLGAQGSQIMAARNWKTGVFTPGDRYYRPPHPMRPALSGYDKGKQDGRVEMLGNLYNRTDPRAAGRYLSDDAADAAAAQEAISTADSPVYQAMIAQPAASTPVNYQGITATPTPAASPGILDSIFSGFGSILGKTATGVAQAQSAGVVRDAQIKAGVLPAQPFVWTTPTGSPSMATYAMIGAGLLGLYLYMKKK